MPREVRRHPSEPVWVKAPLVASSGNLPQWEAPQRAAICEHSGPYLGLTSMNRRRLRKLELIAEGLEQKIVNIEDARWALRDKNGRGFDDDGDESESDEQEETEEKVRCNRILRTIILSDRERIVEFIKAHTRGPDVSIEVPIDLDSTGAYFDVVEEYLNTKITRSKKRLMDIHKTFVSEFEENVKANSLAFLTELHSAIQTFLPTELREMIYAYLLPIDKSMTGDIVHLQLPEFNPDFYVNTGMTGYDGGQLDSEIQITTRSFQAGTQDVHKPGGWLLNPSYVGKDMARDLAKLYYSSYGFSLETRNLKSFLHDDRTETGFKPLEHIKEKLDIFILTTRCNGLEAAWASTNNETEFLDHIYSSLKDLFLLSHIREIPITIRIGTCSPLRGSQMEGDRRFYNVMEAVREPIYDLLHAGINLEVLHVALASHKTRVVSKEPWNFFRLSAKLWQDERQTHGSSWRPSSNFVTREDCQQETLQQLLEQRWGFIESIDSYYPKKESYRSDTIKHVRLLISNHSEHENH